MAWNTTKTNAEGIIYDSEDTSTLYAEDWNNMVLQTVNLSGAQTVTGVKTFTGNIVLGGSPNATISYDGLGITFSIGVTDIFSFFDDGSAYSYDRLTAENRVEISSNGTVGAPSINIGAGAYGFYRDTNNIAVSIAGGQKLSVGASSVIVREELNVDSNKIINVADPTNAQDGATKKYINDTAMGVVVHGATAGTARPTGYVVVTWIGSVEPTNSINNDIWVDTSS